MVKSTILRGSLLSLLIIAGLIGCSNPKSNPVAPAPVFRTGIPLDVNATHIAYSATPYIVSENWVIPEGRTVDIDPGVEIMFDSLWSVTVNGTLHARGTVEQPIIFTSAYVKPSMGQWRGFKLLNPNAGDSSVFRHCVFSWGAFYDTDTTSAEARIYRGMLAIVNSSPVIEHCVIVRNQNNGIFMTGANCAPQIRYNIITKNDASAVRADTLVHLATYLGEPGTPNVSYNCVGENSAISFLMGLDSTRYGSKTLTNSNLDSCDEFFNIDMAPLLVFQKYDPEPPALWVRDGSDLDLQSCSPCIDAGDPNQDFDSDNTRADMGTRVYVQTGGELRGVVSGTLNAATFYRMSCNVRVDAGSVLTIPAGTRIETTGLYTLEVYGRLVVQGVTGNRVRISTGETGGDLWGGIVFLNTDSLFAPSLVEGLDLVSYKFCDVYKPGVVFNNCLFDHGNDYGLLVATKTPDFPDTVRITNCTFNWPGLFGIKADSSAVTVRNTVVTQSRGRGIWLHQVGTAAEVTNCIAYSNTTHGLALDEFSSPLVVNNVFAFNGYHGIDMSNNCNPTVRNTIVYRDSHYGISAALSSVPVLGYNNVYGHLYIQGQDSTSQDYMPPSMVHDETNKSMEPQFVSSTDFHLASGSPCIGAGMNMDGTPTDMGAFGGPNGGGVGAGAIRLSNGGLALK